MSLFLDMCSNKGILKTHNYMIGKMKLIDLQDVIFRVKCGDDSAIQPSGKRVPSVSVLGESLRKLKYFCRLKRRCLCV